MHPTIAAHHALRGNAPARAPLARSSRIIRALYGPLSRVVFTSLVVCTWETLRAQGYFPEEFPRCVRARAWLRVRRCANAWNV